MVLKLSTVKILHVKYQRFIIIELGSNKNNNSIGLPDEHDIRLSN